VPEDAGIEPTTVATSALAVRRSSHSATSQKVSIPAGTEYSVVAADPGLGVPLQLEGLEPEGLKKETSVVRTGGKPTIHNKNHVGF
jgi:hypothetical protein